MGLASKKEEAQTIVTKKGETLTIETKPSPNSFSNLGRSLFGEPIKLIAKDKSGAEVGRLVYMPDGGPIDVFVSENKRRQGIGNALYDAFEKQGGKLPSINSGVAISDEARALRSSRAAGKAGLMAAALGGAGGASAAEIAESFLPLGLTPSTLAPGTLTPEQKAASDEAYRRKLAEERAAKMKAQALLRSGVKQEEPQMAKGGMMARNIPGFQEGGANVDPVSGNEVPTGSLPEEVRDDIDAKLSPGEFVIPADVVRFIGLERLMKMRDEAKKGLQRMSEIGQMGNADEVGEESNSTYEDEGFESEIDDILEEIEAEENDRDVNEQTEVMMAEGGFVKSGTDLTKAPKNPVFDVRYYKNAEGSVMYITHINGKPMTPIPEGYKAVTQEEAQKVGQKAEETAKVEKKPEQESSYEFAPPDPGTFKEQSARNKKLDDALTKTLPAAAKAALPFGMVPTLAQRAAGLFKGPERQGLPASVEERTGVAAQDIRAQEAAATAYQSALNEGISPIDASRAAINAADSVNSGVDPATAAANAVANAQQAAGLTRGIAEEYEALRGTTTPSSRGSSSTMSPASTAATASAIGSGGTITSRNLDLPEDRSGVYDYGGSSYGADSSVGTPDTGRGEPESFSTGDWGGLAKGGLVNKRQYPAKKKRGKGIAAAKS